MKNVKQMSRQTPLRQVNLGAPDSISRPLK